MANTAGTNQLTNTEYTMHNGQKIPAVSFGTYAFQSDQHCYNAILHSLKLGYRSIDTAVYYKSEETVGRALMDAIADGLVQRNTVFITSKVWEDEQGYDNTLRSFEKSLKRMQIDYIDLYLIHRPIKTVSIETYKALIHLNQQGVLRGVGVSNFVEQQLQRLHDETGVFPVLNQVEMHPHHLRTKLHQFHQQHNILTQSWRPLGMGKMLTDTTVVNIAKECNKTPAQILLRWSLDKNAALAVKATSENRIAENINIFNFSLTPKQMKELDNLNQNMTYASRDAQGYDTAL